MLHQTSTTAKPQPAPKACICCGRKLSAAIKHTETALGPVGPECVKKADIAAAIDHLYAHDLGGLVGGEIRLDGLTTSAGTFTFPNAAFEDLKAKAKACGVRLAWRPDVANRQFVVTLKADSLPELLAKVENMLTLSNPEIGAVRVPVWVSA